MSSHKKTYRKLTRIRMRNEFFYRKWASLLASSVIKKSKREEESFVTINSRQKFLLFCQIFRKCLLVHVFKGEFACAKGIRFNESFFFFASPRGVFWVATSIHCSRLIEVGKKVSCAMNYSNTRNFEVGKWLREEKPWIQLNVHTFWQGSQTLFINFKGWMLN